MLTFRIRSFSAIRAFAFIRMPAFCLLRKILEPDVEIFGMLLLGFQEFCRQWRREKESHIDLLPRVRGSSSCARSSEPPDEMQFTCSRKLTVCMITSVDLHFIPLFTMYNNTSSESDEVSTVLEPQPIRGFVETPFITHCTARALTYIRSGFPIHLRGASGTGKTTLALHIAGKLGRPVVLIHGDEQFQTSDLIGAEQGYRFRRLRDNFIASVLKEEENMSKTWIDNRLTVACKHGFTLIYDEYTRSRPEANNVLLSILQERTLALPGNRPGGENYLSVHPHFSAIFTSNPEEYAGTHKSQDALRDRMVTMDLDYFDRETEIAITKAQAKLGDVETERIVDIVRALRKTGAYDFAPTVRGCIMIAKAMKTTRARVRSDDETFCAICKDVLSSETSRLGEKTSQAKVRKIVYALIQHYCGKPVAGGTKIKAQIELVKALKAAQKEKEEEGELPPMSLLKERQLVS